MKYFVGWVIVCTCHINAYVQIIKNVALINQAVCMREKKKCVTSVSNSNLDLQNEQSDQVV